MALPKLNTPVFELELPSTRQKVKYRPFLVREHKTLLAMQEADDSEIARIVKELVDVCTYNTLNVHKLPHFDVEYIFMHLRARSIGEIVDVVMNCPCGNKINTSFNIENLTVEKNPKHSSKIMLTEEMGVEMAYPLFETVLDIYNSDNTNKVIDMVVSCIKGVFDKQQYWEARDQTEEELQDFVYSLTKEQFAKLEDFFVTAPKIVQPVEADCDKCGRHNVSKLEGLSNFFV